MLRGWVHRRWYCGKEAKNGIRLWKLTVRGWRDGRRRWCGIRDNGDGLWKQMVRGEEMEAVVSNTETKGGEREGEHTWFSIGEREQWIDIS